MNEEKVPYIGALVKEILRFFTVIPICLPRLSTQDIIYQDAVIPAGTTFYMNAYAADYDSSHFKDANSFSVERYLDMPNEGSGTSHYAYGAGSRMCSGYQLANKELYIIFTRLIATYRIEPPNLKTDEPILDALECNLIPTSLTTEPKPFKVGLKPRNLEALKAQIAESLENTKDYSN